LRAVVEAALDGLLDGPTLRVLDPGQAIQRALREHTFTVTGSDLSYATQVELMSEDPSNSNRAYAAITSVNAAGTSATYTVNTAGH
jgi:hypothetical protein